MDEDWGVKPAGQWKSIGADPVAVVAKKFNILPFTVRKMMAKLEKVRRMEIEQKLSLRLNRATEFLRVVYDEEAKKAECQRCDKKGFDTFDELTAHVRCHLILDINDPKEASTAQRIAADLDKLFYPQYRMSLRQKRTGILPPDENAEELAERVAGRLGDGS